MSKNEMVVGVPRLGWLADGGKETPATATLLQDDGKRISLTIPWQGSGDSPYERWFCGNTVQWGDDPEGARFSYKVPDVLWFEDGQGHPALTGLPNMPERSLRPSAVEIHTVGGRRFASRRSWFDSP